MPLPRRHQLHQDYVCGCALRVARELFALLPIGVVVATAFEDLLNPQTGQLEPHPLLSVAVPRGSVDRIRWEAVNPSDAMANFIHRMGFKKLLGLVPVVPIQLSELQLP